LVLEFDYRPEKAMTRLEALEKVAQAARLCLPPEAYYPKNEGTAVHSLAKALEELDKVPQTQGGDDLEEMTRIFRTHFQTRYKGEVDRFEIFCLGWKARASQGSSVAKGREWAINPEEQWIEPWEEHWSQKKEKGRGTIRVREVVE